MGIPGLTTHLKPYAVPIVVGCKKPDCELHRSSNDNSGINVIIDGPSFAYTIYARLLAHRPEWLTVLEAMPSYDELRKSTLAFLDELQSYGLNVRAIYFDGYLPTPKRKVRINRLKQSIRKLSDCRQVPQNSTHDKRNWDSASLDPVVVFESGPPISPASWGGINAPFTVPAVLDAISSSKYAKVTSVVPGEAEAYCVSMVRRTGGIILSNDSDLYVFDLGLGKFVRPDSVQLPSSNDELQDVNPEACNTLVLESNSPQGIAEDLGLLDLRGLAYQLTRGYSQTLPEAIKAAKKSHSIDQTGFASFVEEYAIEPSVFESRCFSSEALDRLSTQSQLLDPRISELVCQIESRACRTAHSYLLSLIEDPTRSSAWLVSSGHRIFAYSTCILFLKSASDRANITIEECERRGQEFVMQPITLLPEPEIIDYASNLQTQLQTFATTFFNTPRNLIWRLYALYEVYNWHLNTNKKPPTQELLKNSLTGKLHPQQTWPTIHLSAQIQAVLYSLRMIHQLLIYITSTAIQPLPKPLQDLASTLSTLPPLSKLMPSPPELAQQTARLKTDSILHRLANLLQHDNGIPDPSTPLDSKDPAAWEAVPIKSKKSKTGKKALKVIQSPAATTVQSMNMFDALM